MKRIKKLWMKKRVACTLGLIALRTLAIMATARLAANRLAAQFTRFKAVRFTFIFALAVAVASPAMAVDFTGGPSVRVTPNDKVEFKWSADVNWRAYVEVFDKNDGTGNLITRQESVDGTGAPVTSTDHTVMIDILRLAPDTGFFFKITMTDPTGGNPVPLETQTPLPPFFTGAQSIGTVLVDAGSDRARILWDANVIGTGRVDYGIASPNELSVSDQQNVTSHSIELTGLAPGTAYQYRVCNRHAIDGGCLAAKTGSFATLPSTPQVVQAIDDLRERVASYGLQRGPARSLDAKLEAALAAWQSGDTGTACSSLTAFLNEVSAQAGHKLSEAQAQQLTAAANDIRALIGC